MVGKKLELQDVTKRYHDGTEALRGVTVSVHPGEFVCIIGSSGAGKSTMVRCINRLVDVSSGSILFDDADITRLSRSRLRAARRRMGMVFQGFNLVKRLSTLENVLLGRLGYMNNLTGALGLYSKQDREKAAELLKRVGLEDQQYKRADQLSGGQQQRVGIARAVAQDPALILADEPIASLDPGSAEVVMKQLHQVTQEAGITTLVNLHQVGFAKRFATRIIGLKNGELVFDGKQDDISVDMIKDLYGRNSEEVLEYA